MKKILGVIMGLFCVFLQGQKSDFVEIKNGSEGVVLDMRYATEDNFLKEKVYDCSECYLRKDVAKALMKAQKELAGKGYGIKIFDCYRPLDVQKKMWKIKPGTDYVANPAKGGKHNRGVAVDLTLVYLKTGKEVEMGTGFDYFGKKAHHGYKNLPKKVLENRNLLKGTLEKYGFKSIYSEWWHYEYRELLKAEVENFKFDCENK